MNNLLLFRFTNKVTQYQLAIRTGIPQSRISLLENGLASPNDREKEVLSEEFKVKKNQLFSEN